MTRYERAIELLREYGFTRLWSDEMKSGQDQGWEYWAAPAGTLGPMVVQKLNDEAWVFELNTTHSWEEFENHLKEGTAQ